MNSIVSDWYEKKEHIDEMKGWDKGRLKIWEQQVADKFPVESKILDIGSGMGREAFELYRLGFEVIGLDISDYAVEKANEEAFKKKCNVKFYQYDGEHIPFADEMFDVVIIWSQTFGLLHGDVSKENFINECKRILQQGGLLSYSGHHLQYINEYYNDFRVGTKFYPYTDQKIYWEAFTQEELESYAKKASFEILLSGEGEIYIPEDGTILQCLCKKK